LRKFLAKQYSISNIESKIKCRLNALRWNFARFHGISTFTGTVYIRCATTVNTFGTFNATTLACTILCVDTREQTARK
jgi:hypothetical protein